MERMVLKKVVVTLQAKHLGNSKKAQLQANGHVEFTQILEITHGQWLYWNFHDRGACNRAQGGNHPIH